MRTMRRRAPEREGDHLPGLDLLFAVGVWGVTVALLPLQGVVVGAAVLGAVAVLLVGCVWAPRRWGRNAAVLDWRLPVVGLSLLAGMAALVPGVSPTYADLGEAARLGWMYSGVALIGVGNHILNKLPRVGSST